MKKLLAILALLPCLASAQNISFNVTNGVIEAQDFTQNGISIIGGGGSTTDNVARSMIATASNALETTKASLSGATFSGDIYLGSNDLIGVHDLEFDLSPTAVSTNEGNVYWDTNDHTLAVVGLGGESIQQVGQESWIFGVNKTGIDITNGQVCYVSGAQGERATIDLASATNNNMHSIGVATMDIDNNQSGYVTTFGLVRGVPGINSFTDGAELFLGTSPGQLTTNATDYHIGLVVDSGGSDTIIVGYENFTFATKTAMGLVSNAISTYADAKVDSASNDVSSFITIAPVNAVSNWADTTYMIAGEITNKIDSVSNEFAAVYSNGYAVVPRDGWSLLDTDYTNAAMIAGRVATIGQDGTNWVIGQAAAGGGDVVYKDVGIQNIVPTNVGASITAQRYNTIAGGLSSTINALGSGNSRYNFIGAGNTCLIQGDDFNSIVGGTSCQIIGSGIDYGFIGGGQLNVVRSSYGAILSGLGCEVTGTYGIAMGHYANAGQGSFSWADNQGGTTELDSPRPDSFALAGKGGMHFFSDATGGPGVVYFAADSNIFMTVETSGGSNWFWKTTDGGTTKTAF